MIFRFNDHTYNYNVNIRFYTNNTHLKHFYKINRLQFLKLKHQYFSEIKLIMFLFTKLKNEILNL